MDNLSNPGELEVFNTLKYKRYTYISISVSNYRIPAGSVYWINDAGQLHRENGPAIELKDGSKYWVLNGQLHREDRPAIEHVDGSKEWWINGRFIRHE